ncbi:MAG: sensor histidine kinase [Chitinophagaceae bacterium]
MKKLLFTLPFIFFCLLCQAQDSPKKDSLLKLLPGAKDDSTRIMVLIKVSSLYATDNFDSSLLYMNKAKDLAANKGVTSCDPFINTSFAEYYYYNNDFNKSKEYALKNITIAEKGGNNKLLAKTYNNLAAIYNHFGNYKSAIDYALKCLALSEKTKDSASFPVRYLTASNTYYNLKQYDRSIYYSKKAIEFGNEFNNTFAVMMGLNNLAASYSDKHKIDSAIHFYSKQFDLAQKEDDVVNKIYALINLCYNYYLNNDLPHIEKYGSMLSAIESEMPDKKLIAEISNVRALRLILNKQYSSAKTELDNGIALAIREKAESALGNLYRSYARLYYAQNKFKEAETYSYKYDSLQSASNIRELNFYMEDLAIQYETEKKENKLKLQQTRLMQKNNLIYFLASGVIALLLISLFAYRNYTNRQKFNQAKIDELKKEKLLTATEAVLKGEEQERGRLAKDLHDGLGGMLSGIKHLLSSMKGNLIMTPDNTQAFERSIDMLDSSIREMRRVAHNLMPEMLVKYGLDTALKEFCNEITGSGVTKANYQSIDIDNASIDQTAAVAVYRIVQELVNNAIKHGKANEVLVQLHLLQQEKLLTLTVEDNGTGFDVNLLNGSKGAGWRNVQSRVDFLKGKLDVQSAPGRGTSVLIEINIG